VCRVIYEGCWKHDLLPVYLFIPDLFLEATQVLTLSVQEHVVIISAAEVLSFDDRHWGCWSKVKEEDDQADNYDDENDDDDCDGCLDRGLLLEWFFFGFLGNLSSVFRLCYGKFVGLGCYSWLVLLG
jgi:hypothetical protein